MGLGTVTVYQNRLSRPWEAPVVVATAEIDFDSAYSASVSFSGVEGEIVPLPFPIAAASASTTTEGN